MSEFYCYEGLRDGGTFKLNSTTKTAIEKDPAQIVGKVVTLTSNGEVGYGEAEKAPLGFVEQVEKESTNSEDYVVSVVWHVIHEDVPASGVTAGDWLQCDGSGGVTKSETATNAKAIAFDSDKAVVKID